jgi:CRISPR-associated protein Cas2
VFEGEITEVKLKEMIINIKRIIDEETDSIIIFKNSDQKWLDKQIVGKERSSLDNFI